MVNMCDARVGHRIYKPETLRNNFESLLAFSFSRTKHVRRTRQQSSSERTNEPYRYFRAIGLLKSEHILLKKT